MRHEPLVSIVLPTYNGTRYLDQAVRSCLDQTYTNWELIIVDDASTDDTPVRVAQYAATESRIRSVRHETNRKLPAALNTGFSLAKGEYLTWTSDDNCYRANALAEMVSFLISRPEVDVVYTDYTVIDEAGNPIKSVVVAPVEELVNRNCIGPCFLYRRTVQETLGSYAEDLYLAEDYDFWLRASALFQLQPLHKDLYLYRIHSSSLTSLQGRQAYLAACESLKRNLPRLRWVSRTTQAACYLRIAVAEQSRRNVPELRKCLFYAVRYSPALIGNPTALGLLLDALLGYRIFLLTQRLYSVLKGFRF